MDDLAAVEAVQQQKPLASAMRNFLGMGSGKAAPAAQPARKDPQWLAPEETPVRASASTAARAAAEAAERRKQSSSQPLMVRPSLAATSGFGHNACRVFSWLLLRIRDSSSPNTAGQV